MKHPTLLLLLLLSVNVIGQTESNTDKPKKIQIGVYFSPDICYRSIFYRMGGWVADEIIRERNMREIPNIGYHVGVGVNYNFNHWLGLESGIQFSDNRYATKYMVLVPNEPEPGLPEKVRNIYNMYYISMPLKANFIVGKKKVRFFSTAGLSAGLFLQEHMLTIYKYTDGHLETKRQKLHTSYNKFLLAITVGAGLDWKINQFMSLRIAPEFRYGVTNIIDSEIGGRLWDGGLNLGLWIKI